MPFKTLSELPDRVRRKLPKHAQAIFRSAFNSAWKEYKNKEDRRDGGTREETAYKVAWSAVKHGYKKSADGGKWKRRTR
jgi:cation transport regulator